MGTFAGVCLLERYIPIPASSRQSHVGAAVISTELLMSDKDYKKSRVNMWLVIGALVLIALLIVWLTIADLWGDTDVAAGAPVFITPLTNLLPL